MGEGGALEDMESMVGSWITPILRLISGSLVSDLVGVWLAYQIN